MSYAAVWKGSARGDWDHVDDIGKVFDGRTLTGIEYVVFENQMIDVVLAVLLDNGVSGLLLVTEGASGAVTSEEPVTAVDVPDVLRRMMRGGYDLSVRLEHELLFVHPGFDNKLWLGSAGGFGRAHAVAGCFGLAFDEGAVSPWLLGQAEEVGGGAFRPWPRELPADPGDRGPRDITLRLVRTLVDGTSTTAPFDLLNEAMIELLPEDVPDFGTPAGLSPELERVLDVGRAMAVVEPDEPAHPWNLGARLFDARRFLESGYAHYDAAGRLERGMATAADEEDDRMWRQGACYHAVRAFARAGQLVTAAALLTYVTDPEYRAEAAAEIERRLAEYGSAGG